VTDTSARGTLRHDALRRDSIVAIATAPGRSAVAIVRLSGGETELSAIAARVGITLGALAPRTATRLRVHACDDPATPLDEALVTRFVAPQSYTGETVLEVATHGGSFVPIAVCGALLRAGARQALPGEFTERAVLGGKLDLLRAEAVADLIDARTTAAHRAALTQLDGALSRALESLRAAVIELDALLAYDIDFPEEDGGPVPRARITAACEALIGRLESLLATAPAAVLGRDGVTVVLAGAPNAGKSSLLNALVGELRVIVSDVPGTTRDAIEVLLDHEPWPLRLVDTAGLRATDDPLERLGIEVSERYLAAAHVVVVCGETTATLTETAAAIRARSAAPLVGALTKRDLVSDSYEITTSVELLDAVVPVSAVTGAGRTALIETVTRVVRERLGGIGEGGEHDTPLLTRARHQAAITRARDELRDFRTAWTTGALPAPVAAAHVRAAAHALEELVGAVEVDDVLAKVFASFCVGK
jgi:tRNA modification GTPase